MRLFAGGGEEIQFVGSPLYLRVDRFLSQLAGGTGSQMVESLAAQFVVESGS